MRKKASRLFLLLLVVALLAAVCCSSVFAAGEAPATEKTLIDNGDGTYTLALSVTGAASSSSTTQVTKANVILVVDTSNSMNGSSGTTSDYVYTEFTGTPSRNGTYYGFDENGDPIRVYWRNSAYRTTNSNYGTVYDGTVYTRSGGDAISRIEAEKDALTKDDGIIDNLLSQNVAGDAIKSDIIEVAIANFGTRGTTAQTFTTNADTLKSTINGLSTSTGTNWEEGLMRAQELATSIKASQPDEAIYVIFLTDGEPTTHNNSYSVNTNYATEWGYASDNAREIVTDGYTFYGLFTWGSGTSSHYLSSLVQYAYTGTGNSNSTLDSAYAQYFTDASDTETLIAALNQIVHDITVGVGYTNVELEDGVTSMTTSNVKTTASGEITNMKYYRSGGSYSTTANNGLGEEWTDAPHATVNEDGEVDWDLGSLVLEDGVTYTMTFVVWPSQDSVNLVADLNNGIIDYDSLTPDQKSQISVSGGHYSLKTNTDYPTVTYSTVTTTTVDGETTTVVSDPQTATITNPDPVGIAEEKLNALKSWEDTLDPSQREEISDVVLYLLVDGHYYYVDENGNPMGVTLTEESNWTVTDYISIAPGLLVAEGSAAYDEEAPQVTWEGTTYAILEVGHEYVFEESDINNHFELTAYTHHPMIMGSDIVDVIFTKDSAGNITGIESVSNMGDNLSATNTLKGGINIQKKVVDAENNELNSQDTFDVTVHLTDADGNALPTKTAADGTKYTIDYRIYYGENNPAYATSGDKHRSDHIYKTGTNFEETLYVGDVIRVVNVEDGALFCVYETLPQDSNYVNSAINYQYAYGTDTPAAYTEDDIVVKDNVNWYPVMGNTASTATVINTVPVANIAVKKTGINDTALAGVKFELYYTYDANAPENNVKAKNADGDEVGTLTTGQDGTVSVGDMIAGTYYLVETETNAGYKLLEEPVEIKITKDGDNFTVTYDGNEATSVDGVYTVTVVNEALCFYVYHSSDCTVEKVAITDPRVTVSDDGTFTFNIANETKENNLYGGYFSAYKGTTKTSDQIMALEYSDASSGNYTYTDSHPATGNWSTDTGATKYTDATATMWTNKTAYTTTPGTAMNPTADTVYYLKEIPDQYFRPATYYVYDTRSENKELKKLYLMVPTDDNLYLYVQGTPADMITQNKKLYGTFKVVNDTGATESFKVNKVNSNLTHGYLTVWDITSYIQNTDQSYVWTPNFVTKDGVTVTSVVTRTISIGNGCHGGFTTSDEKVASKIST